MLHCLSGATAWRLLPTLSILLAACSQSAAPPATAPPPEVRVVSLKPQSASIENDYVGQVEASSTVEIRPRVGGLLEQLAAEEGARVRRGQLLFEIDPQPYREALAQAKAALAEARAAELQAQRDLSRVKPLLELDAVSQQELDAAEAREQAGAAAVDAAKAAVRTAELNLEYTQVRSPIDGVMGRAQLRVGGLVTAYSTLLTTVYATDPMFVNFSVSEQRMLELPRRKGFSRERPDRARIFRLRLADGSEYPHPASIDFVDAAVDPRTGTLPMRLSVPNPDGLLVSGQFARVVTASTQRDDALLLPQRAVQELQGNRYVWVVDAEGQAQRRDVEMGSRVGQQWLVVSGLQAGERVVVEGLQRLRPGLQVNALPLDPPPASQAAADETATDAATATESADAG